jgi:hypothetical protein
VVVVVAALEYPVVLDDREVVEVVAVVPVVLRLVFLQVVELQPNPVKISDYQTFYSMEIPVVGLLALGATAELEVAVLVVAVHPADTIASMAILQAAMAVVDIYGHTRVIPTPVVVVVVALAEVARTRMVTRVAVVVVVVDPVVAEKVVGIM